MTSEKTEPIKVQTKKEEKEIKKGSVKQNESIYKLEELAKGAENLFGTSPECVYAALKQEGITECTKSKAQEIVKKFRERKVK